MSTQTQNTPAEPAPHVEEYPCVLYKLVPRPKPQPPEEEMELQSVVAENEQEAKKKIAEGWSKEVPSKKPKPPAAAHTNEEMAKKK